MKNEAYLALDFQDPSHVVSTGSRRDFLKQLGTGIIIFVSLGDLGTAAGPPASGAGAADCRPISTPF